MANVAYDFEKLLELVLNVCWQSLFSLWDWVNYWLVDFKMLHQLRSSSKRNYRRNTYEHNNNTYMITFQRAFQGGRISPLFLYAIQICNTMHFQTQLYHCFLFVCFLPEQIQHSSFVLRLILLGQWRRLYLKGSGGTGQGTKHLAGKEMYGKKNNLDFTKKNIIPFESNQIHPLTLSKDRNPEVVKQEQGQIYEAMDNAFAISGSSFLYVSEVTDIQVKYALFVCAVLQILLSAPLWSNPKQTSFHWVNVMAQCAVSCSVAAEP